MTKNFKNFFFVKFKMFSISINSLFKICYEQYILFQWYTSKWILSALKTGKYTIMIWCDILELGCQKKKKVWENHST